MALRCQGQFVEIRGYDDLPAKGTGLAFDSLLNAGPVGCHRLSLHVQSGQTDVP
jgi:hypothetical protein